VLGVATERAPPLFLRTLTQVRWVTGIIHNCHTWNLSLTYVDSNVAVCWIAGICPQFKDSLSCAENTPNIPLKNKFDFFSWEGGQSFSPYVTPDGRETPQPSVLWHTIRRRRSCLYCYVKLCVKFQIYGVFTAHALDWTDLFGLNHLQWCDFVYAWFLLCLFNPAFRPFEAAKIQ